MAEANQSLFPAFRDFHLLDTAKRLGLLDDQRGGTISPEADLKIELENFPRCMRTHSRMSGAFKKVEVARGRPISWPEQA